MTFLGVYQASCGQILMKIGGNQAEAFPDLAIQPRNQDCSSNIQFTALELFKFVRLCFLSNMFFLLTTVYLIAQRAVRRAG